MPSLLTDALKSRLPGLYSQEHTSDPIVQVLLLGVNGWLWALTEYSDVAPDGCPNLAFGWVAGDESELGYISLDEMDELNIGCLPGHGFVWVETHFNPCPLSKVRAEADAIRRRLTAALRAGEQTVIRLL